MNMYTKLEHLLSGAHKQALAGAAQRVSDEILATSAPIHDCSEAMDVYQLTVSAAGLEALKNLLACVATGQFGQDVYKDGNIYDVLLESVNSAAAHQRTIYNTFYLSHYYADWDASEKHFVLEYSYSEIVEDIDRAIDGVMLWAPSEEFHAVREKVEDFVSSMSESTGYVMLAGGPVTLRNYMRRTLTALPVHEGYADRDRKVHRVIVLEWQPALLNGEVYCVG